MQRVFEGVPQFIRNLWLDLVLQTGGGPHVLQTGGGLSHEQFNVHVPGGGPGDPPPAPPLPHHIPPVDPVNNLQVRVSHVDILVRKSQEHGVKLLDGVDPDVLV